MKVSGFSLAAASLATPVATALKVDYDNVAPIDIVNGMRYCEVKCMAQEIPNFCPGSFDDIRCHSNNMNQIQQPFNASAPFLTCMANTCTESEREYGKARGFYGLALRITGFSDFGVTSPKPTEAEIDAASKPWGDRLRAAAAGKKSNPSGPYAAPPPGDKPYDEAVKGGSSSDSGSDSGSSSGSSGDKKSGASQLSVMGAAFVAPAIIAALL